MATHSLLASHSRKLTDVHFSLNSFSESPFLVSGLSFSTIADVLLLQLLVQIFGKFDSNQYFCLTHF